MRQHLPRGERRPANCKRRAIAHVLARGDGECKTSAMGVTVLDREMFTEAEAARLLRVSQNTLNYWLEGGEYRGLRYRPVMREQARGSHGRAEAGRVTGWMGMWGQASPRRHAPSRHVAG